MNSLKIIIPGLLSTIQDGGRVGQMAFGFSQCGAMDTDAMMLANALLDNDLNDAVIEMTLMGISAQALNDIYVAVTGGICDVFVDGEKAEMNRALLLKKGSYITIGNTVKGCRSYLAIRGGISVPAVMGSRSTFLKIGMGGFEGRKLAAGDILSSEERKPLKKIEKRDSLQPRPIEEKTVLRAILGPQDDMFSTEEIEKFFGREYKVSPSSDRMGIRLEGEEAIISKNGSDIISDGIVLGSVQIPKNGQPIILASDRQTTGGYAKMVTVISADMPKLAQLTPGSVVIFEKIEIEKAQKIREDKLRYFENLKRR